MIAYSSYFKTKILNNLQYKSAAIAGIATQIFWGFLNIMVFTAFYSHITNTDISFEELTSYIWLNQAFLILIYMRVKNRDIIDNIKNGTVAYELCRPYNLYIWWYIKHLSEKYASVLLRFLPIIIIGLMLPTSIKLHLPASLTSFILFIITLFIGSLLICAITMIIQSIAFFTNESKGISDIIYIIADLFNGSLLPLPLMPKIIQQIGNYLPFRLISDLPFRIYSGNINVHNAIISIVIQLIWLIILVSFGILIMKKALKNISIQGG